MFQSLVTVIKQELRAKMDKKYEGQRSGRTLPSLYDILIYPQEKSLTVSSAEVMMLGSLQKQLDTSLGKKY